MVSDCCGEHRRPDVWGCRSGVGIREEIAPDGMPVRLEVAEEEAAAIDPALVTTRLNAHRGGGFVWLTHDRLGPPQSPPPATIVSIPSWNAAAHPRGRPPRSCQEPPQPTQEPHVRTTRGPRPRGHAGGTASPR